MKSKKALAISFIAAMILILVFIVVMFMFEIRAGELYRNIVSKNTCKSSVRAQDIGTIKNIALPSDIKCPLQRIEIEENDPEKIKQKFAKLYYDVCDEFGQGTLNLFGKRETTFCVIRDSVSFKNKNIKINDFGKYLAENKIPGKDINYIQFCSGYKTERAAEIYKDIEVKQFTDDTISTDKEYAIIFVYAKGEEQLREIMNFAFGTSVPHIGFYVGVGFVALGYGVTAATKGVGGVIGLPLAYLGNLMMYGGLATAGVSGFFNWLTNENIRMEWASFFLIREFNEQELKKLPCEYLPAEQS